MSTEHEKITITLLGQEYSINSPDGDADKLIRTAKLFDNYLQNVRKTGGVAGTSRLFMIAGINMASDLLKTKEQDQPSGELDKKLEGLCKKVKEALDPLRQ